MMVYQVITIILILELKPIYKWGAENPKYILNFAIPIIQPTKNSIIW